MVDRIQFIQQSHPGGQYYLNEELGILYLGCGPLDSSTQLVEWLVPNFLYQGQVLKGDFYGRIKNDLEIYTRLQGTGMTPTLLDSWDCWAFELAEETWEVPRRWLWLLTERMDGNLDDLLAENPSEEVLQGYLDQITELIYRFNHVHHLIHGDLHPGNLLFRRHPDSSVSFVLIDFDHVHPFPGWNNLEDYDNLAQILQQDYGISSLSYRPPAS